MRVNQATNGAMAFFLQYTRVIDNGPLLLDGIPSSTPTESTPPNDRRSGRNVEVDEQSTEAPSHSHEDQTLLEGSIVQSRLDGRIQNSIIIKAPEDIDGGKQYIIRHVNEEIEHVVSAAELTPIPTEPSGIP